MKSLTIKGIRADVERLTVENRQLKMNERAVKEALEKYTAALTDVNMLKEKYKKALSDLEKLKTNYKSEMDALLERVRKGK